MSKSSSITALAGSINFKYDVNNVEITDPKISNATSSPAVTVYSYVSNVTADPNPVETTSGVTGTLEITFSNNSGITSGEVMVTISQFAGTNTQFTVQSITYNSTTETIGTAFSIGTIDSGSSAVITVVVSYAGDTIANDNLVISATEGGTNITDLPTITANAVFAIITGTIDVVDDSYAVISSPVVMNGTTINYLASLTNTGDKATKLTIINLTVDNVGFTATALSRGTSTSSLEADTTTDITGSTIEINPTTPIVIAETSGTYYVLLTGTANYNE